MEATVSDETQDLKEMEAGVSEQVEQGCENAGETGRHEGADAGLAMETNAEEHTTGQQSRSEYDDIAKDTIEQQLQVEYDEMAKNKGLRPPSPTGTPGSASASGSISS